MQEKRWFCSLLDVFGILSLTGGIIALAGAISFVDVISESLLFKVFYGCLAAAVVSFLISRTVEILTVIAHTPDPRRLRVEPVVEPVVAVTASVVARDQEDSDGSFPRAA
jgi:hypothetical protein